MRTTNLWRNENPLNINFIFLVALNSNSISKVSFFFQYIASSQGSFSLSETLIAVMIICEQKLLCNSTHSDRTWGSD